MNRHNKWTQKPLGELTEILDGKRKPISKELRTPGPIPYYGACGVVDFVDSFLFDEPLVLVGEDGAKWGQGESTAFIITGKSWVNNHAHVLRPNRVILDDYWLVCWLNSQDLSQYISGLTVPKLNQANLRGIPIPLPPLAEQRKIAEILRTWDEAIEAAEAELKAKQERKRWMAKVLVSGEVRLSGYSSKWKKARLSDLFKRVTRKNAEGCQRCLTISAENGLVDQREYFDRRISSADTSAYFLMKRGEFAYNRSYSNGYPYGVVKRLNAYDVGTVTTLYLVFASMPGACDPLYMEHVFDSGILNKGLRTIVQEGARAHGLLNVKAEDFFSLSIHIPGNEEQEAISNLICTAQLQVTASISRLALLRAQKRGLMQKLLTGEVRVIA